MTSRTHTPKDVQKIMELWRDSASDYERGFIDGMQEQMQSSVDKAVNAMAQRTWVGLTDEEIDKAWRSVDYTVPWEQHRIDIAQAIEQALKEKNV